MKKTTIILLSILALFVGIIIAQVQAIKAYQKIIADNIIIQEKFQNVCIKANNTVILLQKEYVTSLKALNASTALNKDIEIFKQFNQKQILVIKTPEPEPKGGGN